MKTRDKSNKFESALAELSVDYLDCFMCGWNAHRVRTPRREEEGYDFWREGWDARKKFTKPVTRSAANFS